MKKRELIEEVYTQLNEARRDIKDIKIQLSELLNLHNKILSKEEKCQGNTPNKCNNIY